MSPQVAYLLARIAEDEMKAREITDAIPFTLHDPHVILTTNPEGGLWGAVAMHPARMLAECDAKRKILDLHYAIDAFPGYEGGDCHECSDSGWQAAVDSHSGVSMPCPTVRLLLQPYADRDDFDPTWKD